MRNNAYDDYYKKVWKTLDRMELRHEKFEAEAAERQKKADAEMEALRREQIETAEQMKETDRRMKETDRRMGKFINGFGEFVEYLAAPSLPKVMKRYGIHVLHYAQNALSRRNGDSMEIDVLAYGKTSDEKEVVLLTEIKSTVTPEDVNALLLELETFPKFFPEYKAKPRLGVVAGIKVPENVIKHAERKGLFVLVPSGDTMRAANKKGFKPKFW